MPHQESEWLRVAGPYLFDGLGIRADYLVYVVLNRAAVGDELPSPFRNDRLRVLVLLEDAAKDALCRTAGNPVLGQSANDLRKPLRR